MPLSICPGCQTSYKVPEHLQGKKIRCKKCQHVFPVQVNPVTRKEAVQSWAEEDEREEISRGENHRSKAPREVRRAIILLSVLGFLKAAIPLTVWSVMRARNEWPPDEIGWILLVGMTVFLGILAAMAFMAAILLGYRNRLGRILAWPSAIASLAGFPLFTFFGLVIIKLLLSQGMRDYFTRDQEDEGGAAEGAEREKARAPLVVGGAIIGVLVLAAVGFGIWKWMTPTSPPREARVVQAPALKMLGTYPGRSTERMLVAGPASNQAGIVAGGMDGKQAPLFDRYDASTGKLLSHTELTNVRVPQQMALSLDGAYLAVAQLAKDQEAYHSTITIWSLANGKVFKDWKPYPAGGFEANLSWMTFLDNNRLLAITRGGHVSAWDLQGKGIYSVRHEIPGSALGLQEDVYTKQPQNFAVSGDRKTVALFNGESFTLLDAETGNEKGKTPGVVPRGTEVHGVALDRAATQLAACVVKANQEEFSVWDLKNNEPPRSYPIRCKVVQETGSSDWRSTAITWWDSGHVLLWNASKNALVVEAATGKVVREVVIPALGSSGFVDADGRLWYQSLLTQPAANVLVCAVKFPLEDLQLYSELEEGKYYPRWFMNPSGLETQPDPSDFRKLPRVTPAR